MRRRGRVAQYTKKSKIARLPPYLAVNFVRFAWRKDTNKRAKILRTVSFPEVPDGPTRIASADLPSFS